MCAKRTLATFIICIAIALSLITPLRAEEDPDAQLKHALYLADLYNWIDAAPFFVQAEQLYRERGDERNALYAHLGVIRSTMEQLVLPATSLELESLLESNALLQSDKQLRLFCLIVKGDIDAEIDANPARQDWEEAFQVAADLGDSKWKNRASAEIGFALFLQGDVMQARQRVTTALITATAAQDVGAQIRYLAAIGTGLVLVQRYDEGLVTLDKALKLAQATPDAGYPFLVQAGRLQAYQGLRTFDTAQQLADEIIAQARSRQRYVKETQALIIAAEIARAKKEGENAIDDLKMAIELGQKGGFQRLLADAQFKLADLYREEGDIAKATPLAAAAAEKTQNAGDIYLVPERLMFVGKLQEAQLKYAEADETFDRAEDILDTMIGNVTSVEAKTVVITSMSDVYAAHFALLADHFDNTDKAYSVLERARGRVITDLLLSEGQAGTPQRRKIERNIAQLNVELSRARTSAEIRRIRNQIFLAEQARWLEPGSSALKSHSFKTIDLSNVQASLSSDELVLEYVLATPQSYCLAFTHESAHVVALPDRGVIESRVQAFLNRIKDRQEITSEDHDLYAAILKDVPDTKKKRWIVVPDGALHLVPFDALRDHRQRYLLESHIISYAPSTSAMYLQTKSSLQARPANYALLGVGGIPYSQREDLNKIAKASGYIGDKLTDLPGSEAEVTAASRTFGGQTRLLLGRQATESAFKRTPLDQYRVIHLAVHGVADERHPSRAALLMLDDPSAGQDGILKAPDIVGLHTTADLVVLSACNTAVGRLEGEEGMANISTAFLLAGARNVISTLWSADDIASSELIKRFYSHLGTKETIANALTLAKRELVRSYGSRALPYYWAGFILEGVGDSTVTPRPADRTSADVKQGQLKN